MQSNSEILGPEIQGKVNAILCDLFELEEKQIQPEAKLFQELGLDSLDAIDLVIAFQQEFRIHPENSELQSIRTVNDVYGLVAKYYESTKASQ